MTMINLKALAPNIAVRGILPHVPVMVANVSWFGSSGLELRCKGPSGHVTSQLVCCAAASAAQQALDAPGVLVKAKAALRQIENE
jgi:hypothetical protein